MCIYVYGLCVWAQLLPKRAVSASADEIGIFTQPATGLVYYILLYLNIFFSFRKAISGTIATGNERPTGFTKTVFAAARNYTHPYNTIMYLPKLSKVHIIIQFIYHFNIILYKQSNYCNNNIVDAIMYTCVGIRSNSLRFR
jgi:hypothetical protein